MRPDRQRFIRFLFDEYIEMYATRDDRLADRFSDNFSGYAGASDVLIQDRAEWVRITRQDFAQVPGRLDIELLDLSMQDLCDDVVVATAFFHIHLPVPDHILSRETARLVLIFRHEGEDWKIAHSGISIPYPGAGADEVYPLQDLAARNLALEALVEERTQALADANLQLERLSNTDWLTGIANRRAFERELEGEWKRGQRAGMPLAVIMVDVDRFKHFNDGYGHLAGDECLRVVAEALVRAAGRRTGDLVARYGGEEFVVMLPDTDGPAAVDVAKRIQQEVWTLAFPHGDTTPGIITVSLGIASQIPWRALEPSDLVRRADAAMYRAKQAGRNCLVLAED
jgi:diguanylate cyclase (GGDEF)-like protein